jgi:hypothetical protein
LQTAKSHELRTLIDIFTDNASSLQSSWNAATVSQNRPNALRPESAIELFLENASRRERSETSQEALLAYVSGRKERMGEQTRSLHAVLSSRKIVDEDVRDATAAINPAELGTLDIAYLKDAAKMLARKPAQEIPFETVFGIEALITDSQQAAKPTQQANQRAELANALRKEAEKSRDRFMILTNAYASFDSSQFIRQETLAIGRTILSRDEWEGKLATITDLLIRAEQNELTSYEKNYISEAIQYIDGNRKIRRDPNLQRAAASVTIRASRLFGEEYSSYRRSKEELAKIARHLKSASNIPHITIVEKEVRELLNGYSSQSKAALGAAPIGEYFRTLSICDAIDRDVGRISKKGKATIPEQPHPSYLPRTWKRKLAYVAAAVVSAITLGVAAYQSQKETDNAPEPTHILAEAEQAEPAPQPQQSRHCAEPPGITDEEFCSRRFERDNMIEVIQPEEVGEVVRRCFLPEVAKIRPEAAESIARRIRETEYRGRPIPVRVFRTEQGIITYSNPLGSKIPRLISGYGDPRRAEPISVDEETGNVECHEGHMQTRSPDGTPGCASRHQSADLMPADGSTRTKIYSPRPGTITTLGQETKRAGTFVTIQYFNGDQSTSAHLERFSPPLEMIYSQMSHGNSLVHFRPGEGPLALPYPFEEFMPEAESHNESTDRDPVGRIIIASIGIEGRTGNALGPHLHLATKSGGRYLITERLLPIEIPGRARPGTMPDQRADALTGFSHHHEDILRRFASVLGIVPEMLLQIRSHEARYMEMRSSAGAYGFMQVLQRSALAAARACERYSIDDSLCERLTWENVRTDPMINLLTGAIIFRMNLDANG